MFAPAGSQFQVLGAQGGFEDEHVEVDHGRRAGCMVQRIGGLPSTHAAGTDWVGLDFVAGLRCALDDGVDRVRHSTQAEASRRRRGGGRAGGGDKGDEGDVSPRLRESQGW